MEFALSTNGNVIVNNKRILYFEKYQGGIYPYIKGRKKKQYLTMPEIAEFKRAGAFFIARGSDFGEDINNFILKI